MHLMLEGLPRQIWQMNSHVGDVQCLCRADTAVHDLETCARFCTLYEQSPVTGVAIIS